MNPSGRAIEWTSSLAMRNQNTALVLRLFLRHGVLARAELAERTRPRAAGDPRDGVLSGVPNLDGYYTEPLGISIAASPTATGRHGPW